MTVATIIRRFATAAVLACVASASAAQAVRGCDDVETSARNVYWPDATRTFAQGAIRFVMLDKEEPAASFRLMVTFPAVDGPFLDCRLVSADARGAGWSDLSLSAATATYDPARGLTVRVPGTEAAPVQTFPNVPTHSETFTVDVTVNQATGTVTVAYGPP